MNDEVLRAAPQRADRKPLSAEVNDGVEPAKLGQALQLRVDVGIDAPKGFVEAGSARGRRERRVAHRAPTHPNPVDEINLLVLRTAQNEMHVMTEPGQRSGERMGLGLARTIGASQQREGARRCGARPRWKDRERRGCGEVGSYTQSPLTRKPARQSDTPSLFNVGVKFSKRQLWRLAARHVLFEVGAMACEERSCIGHDLVHGRVATIVDQRIIELVLQHWMLGD